MLYFFCPLNKWLVTFLSFWELRYIDFLGCHNGYFPSLGRRTVREASAVKQDAAEKLGTETWIWMLRSFRATLKNRFRRYT